MGDGVSPAEKQCLVCKQTKDRLSFYADKKTKTGLHSWCKSCHSEKSMLRRMALGMAKQEQLKDKQEQLIETRTKEGKVCSRCHELKPLEEFPNRRHGSIDGHESSCQKCKNASRVKRYPLQAEKVRAKRKAYVGENKSQIAARKKTQRREFADWYVKKLLLDGTNLKAADITPELVQLKREQLLLQVLAKEMEQASKRISDETIKNNT